MQLMNTPEHRHHHLNTHSQSVSVAMNFGICRLLQTSYSSCVRSDHMDSRWTGTGSGTGSGTSSDSDSGTSSGTDSGTGSDTGSGTSSDTDSGTGSGTSSDTGSGPGSDTGSGTNTGISSGTVSVTDSNNNEPQSAADGQTSCLLSSACEAESNCELLWIKALNSHENMNISEFLRTNEC